MKIAIANACDRLVEFGIIFLVIFTPVYYGSVTQGAITVIELTTLFMLLIWGVGMLIRGEFVFRRTSLDIVILLFCAYSLISTLFFSKYTYASYTRLYLVLCISALYFIVVNHIRSRAQLTRLFVVILLVGFVHAFSHLIQNATGLYGKSTGVMFNVGNHFAGYMVIIIPLAVAMSFVIKDVGKRIVLIFVSIVMAAAMAFSLIAGAMLAFLFSLMLVALLFAGSGNTRKQALILGGVVLCSLLIISWFGYQPVLKELLTVTNMEAGSPAGRLSLWKSSLAMFADNPITGTGLGTFDHIYPKYRLPDIVGRAIYTHSDWLQLLTELGAIGFIIVLLGSVLFFLSVLKRSVLVKQPALAYAGDDWTKGLVVGGVSSVGAGLVHALVEFNFHIPAIAVLFAIIIALTVVVSLSARYSAQESSIQHLPQWRIRVPAFARIGGFACLLLVIGFSSVAMIRPCIADAYYQDGVKLEESLLWDEAAGKYQSALDLSRSNSDYFYALGKVYARRAKLNQGTEMHDKWYRSALNAYHQAMVSCPMKGNYPLALGRLQEVAGNAKDAESAYIKAISLDPNNAFYHRIYGSFCLRQGSIQKAVTEYKRTLDIYPNYFYNLLEECDLIDSRTQGSEKQSLLGIARQFCPQNAGSHITLARFCEDKGWYDDAFSEYQKAIALATERIDLRQRLSRLLMRQGKFEEVVNLWRQFLKFHPQNAQAHIQLAAVYIKQKRLNDAIQQYLAAANIEPDNSSYCITAGDLYMQQGESSKAIELWQTVIRKKPREGAAHYRLGRHYEAQGDWLVALNFLKRAVAAEPKNVGYRLHLAQSYYRKDLFYEAIREWERALKLQPENVSIHLRLARVYQQIDRQDKAKGHYHQVLKLQPENVEAQRALSGKKDI